MPAVEPITAIRDNQQRVGQGTAFLGEVHGDAYFMGAGPGLLDDAVTEQVLKPRLREGPYPADEVERRLRGFVEPPSHAQCRKALDNRLLVLSAEDGTGAATEAFALLAERYGAGGITGLDPMEDLTRWRPKEARGYLLQGLPREAADAFGDVMLRGLAELLRRAGAHLVVTAGREVRLPAGVHAWRVPHTPPSPKAVVARRLRAMADAGELTGAQLATASRQLTSGELSEYLRAHPLPGDAVELAAGLGAAVVAGTPVAAVLDDLRLGGDAAANAALDKARHSADAVALLAAVALLHRQDRTVIERFAARLRPLVEDRGGAEGTARLAERGPSRVPERADVLGPSFEDRLRAVGAELLPPEPASAAGGRQRYTVRPVVFAGRHRPEPLLRRLWLDHEGMADLLWQALDALPHQPGTDLAAGQAIGAVLAHATGPGALRALTPFAASNRRWQRRLVAFAVGEAAQRPALAGAAQEQLRQWSRSRQLAVRGTVAETCAATYGLARPASALGLVDAVLDGPEEEADRALRSAASFALSVLLTEDPNHGPVLDRVTRWLAAEPGTLRHAFAADVVVAMAVSTFPLPGRSGPRKVSLADVVAAHPRRALALVGPALETPATHEAVAEGLLTIERDPHQRRRTDLAAFLGALAEESRRGRGVTRFLLRRHRERPAARPERTAS
ncbi:hypothetical protein [Streptomyces sp. NPDC002328]|uniref:hypothetical protein n=1 Tax=Streptomyces sp. NPDC002328 TaxID=3364642 RepID=UPI0036D032AB